jgi:hypothetical protein
MIYIDSTRTAALCFRSMPHSRPSSALQEGGVLRLAAKDVSLIDRLGCENRCAVEMLCSSTWTLGYDGVQLYSAGKETRFSEQEEEEGKGSCKAAKGAVVHREVSVELARGFRDQTTFLKPTRRVLCFNRANSNDRIWAGCACPRPLPSLSSTTANSSSPQEHLFVGVHPFSPCPTHRPSPTPHSFQQLQSPFPSSPTRRSNTSSPAQQPFEHASPFPRLGSCHCFRRPGFGHLYLCLPQLGLRRRVVVAWRSRRCWQGHPLQRRD